MPAKTKKPTTKSKSTKKSPGKLDRVIKKLNLARPRNQFIVAFLVVGVLGGGYFAYQSFAASLMFYPSSMRVTAGSGSIGTDTTTVQNGKTQTVQIYTITANSTLTTTNAIPVPTYKNVRFCASARSPFGASNVKMTIMAQINTSTTATPTLVGPRTVSLGTNYTYICSGYIANGTKAYITPLLSSGSLPINVQNFSIEY